MYFNCLQHTDLAFMMPKAEHLIIKTDIKPKLGDFLVNIARIITMNFKIKQIVLVRFREPINYRL